MQFRSINIGVNYDNNERLFLYIPIHVKVIEDESFQVVSHFSILNISMILLGLLTLLTELLFYGLKVYLDLTNVPVCHMK